MTDFLVRRDDLRVWQAVDTSAQSRPHREVTLRVERFALTANNLTYGSFGDQLGYWRFFPAPGRLRRPNAGIPRSSCAPRPRAGVRCRRGW